MAGKTREIKTRIKATANIKRITKTMQMIATAKFQAAQRETVAAKPYAQTIARMASELAAAIGTPDSDQGPSHPLLRRVDRPRKTLLLVITSNRGLCGAYNSNVLKRAMAQVREPSCPIELEIVGKKAVGFFKYNEVPVARVHEQLADKVRYEPIAQLAQTYMDRFIAGEVDRVLVTSMRFESLSRQSVAMTDLLPLTTPAAEGQAGESKAADYEFLPDAASLLAAILPVTVKTRLLQLFQEAVLSENIARMVAMKGATDAASKMGKRLTRDYNRARQAAITTELSEIIAGAAALG